MVIQLIRVCDPESKIVFGHSVRRMDGNTVVKAVWVPGEMTNVFAVLEKVQRQHTEEVTLAQLEIPLEIVQD